MQAVPAANALPQISPPSGPVANASAVPSGQPSEPGLAPGADGGEAVSFEQVLAAQIDVSQIRPELLMAAANADIEETPVDEQGVLFNQDAGQPLVFPTLNLTDPAAERSRGEDGLAHQAVDAAVRIEGKSAEGRAHAGDAEALDANSTLSDPLRQIRSSVHGLQASDDERNAGALEGIQDTGSVHGSHSAAEPHRTAGSRGADPAFNPRQIPEPVQSPRWGEALGQRVVWMAKENVQVVYLQVEPPNLGPLEVQLRLTNDQANVMFSSAHAAVREAISGSLSTLDELLAAGGVSLGSVSVNTQSPSQDSGQTPGQPSGRGNGWGAEDSSGAIALPAPVRVAVGLVDTFA